MSTHAAIAVTAVGVLETIQVPTLSPGAGEVLLKHEYTSMIAFDTYITDLGYMVSEFPAILGFNTAGTVQKAGEGLDILAVGDRVTAFSFQQRGMQEYSVQSSTVIAKIPNTLSFKDAATIPDNFVTAFHTLFNPINLGLPSPSSFPATIPPVDSSNPILIYGAGSTTGQYAIQLTSLAGYKTIIATASTRHHAFLKSLGATHVFDYKSPSLPADIAAVAIAAGFPDGKVERVVDCVSAEATLGVIAKLVSPDKGLVAILLPVKEGENVRGKEGENMYFEFPPNRNPLPNGTRHVGVRTFLYQENEHLKQNLMPKILPEMLVAGIIKPNRVRLLEEGTLQERVEIGLDLLRNNKVSGEKVVVKIGK